MSEQPTTDPKRSNNYSIFLKATGLGIFCGIIICLFYLFLEREKLASFEYKNYFLPLAEAAENFKKNAVAICDQAETLIGGTEISPAGKEELIAIINGNINLCEKSISELEMVVVPYGAHTTKKDLNTFFNEAKNWLESVITAIKNNDRNALSDIKNDLTALSQKKIYGFDYKTDD